MNRKLYVMINTIANLDVLFGDKDANSVYLFDISLA